MKEAKNELMQFVAGIVMLAVGLYILSQKVIVFSGYGGFFSFGGGRIWMFTTGANFASKVFTAFSVLLIIVSVIMSTHIHLSSMTLYEWILLLVLIFGGAGLVAKVLFAGSASDDKKKKSSRKGKGDDIDSSFSSVKNIEDELEQMKKNIK